MDAPAAAEKTPGTYLLETLMAPVLPIQVVSEAEDGPSAPIAEGLPSLSNQKNHLCVKKTFAKILYQCELDIDSPEQDDKVKKDIMRYMADNLKIEYTFDGKQLFVFSPMNVTDNHENSLRPEENPNPYSFRVEGIKTSENWDNGRYETNMSIQLKKRSRALEAVQAEPGRDGETEMAQVEEKCGTLKKIFGNKFQSIAFGMVIALLVGLAVALMYVDLTE